MIEFKPQVIIYLRDFLIFQLEQDHKVDIFVEFSFQHELATVIILMLYGNEYSLKFPSKKTTTF
jgi:hypothetical protein